MTAFFSIFVEDWLVLKMSRSFESTRRFDGMSHKTVDLKSFRFVMICKFALMVFKLCYKKDKLFSLMKVRFSLVARFYFNSLQH
jgi:hypothetical protein